MLTRRTDLLVRTPLGLPIVLVEIRNRQNLTLDVAMELQHDLLDYYGVPLDGVVPYFLMLSQETGYLWNLRTQPHRDAPPICVFPTGNLLRRYWTDHSPGERISERSLAMLVYHWLNILTYEAPPDEDPEKSLQATGFLELLHDAVIEREDSL